MHTATLGPIGVVSRLTLGGGGIGQLWGETSKEEAIATIGAALDGGITVLDAAPGYHNCETFIGEHFAGRLPVVRTLGSATLSVVVVGMGASLGREGAPKQAGAVIANAMSDRVGLSDEQRRLLVACGAGAGMAAASG